MWVSRSRIGMAAALGMATTITVACDNSKGPPLTSGASSDASIAAGDASLDASSLDTGSKDGALDGRAADAAWCHFPYDCPDAAGFDASPPTKDGATAATDASVTG